MFPTIHVLSLNSAEQLQAHDWSKHESERCCPKYPGEGAAKWTGPESVLVLVLYSKRHTSGVEIADHVVLLWDVIATIHCFRKMEFE